MKFHRNAEWNRVGERERERESKRISKIIIMEKGEIVMITTETAESRSRSSSIKHKHKGGRDFIYEFHSCLNKPKTSEIWIEGNFQKGFHKTRWIEMKKYCINTVKLKVFLFSTD